MKVLHINGNDLSLEDVSAVVYERRPVLLDPEARVAVDRARGVVEVLVENNLVGYAVTTGVGQLSDVRIPPDDIRKLQVNLMRSHAVGVGEPLSRGSQSRHDAAAGELPRQGLLGRARHRHRHPLRTIKPGRAPRNPVARQRGSQRRPGPSVASRPGAHRAKVKPFSMAGAWQRPRP